jgi:hypothetical protein
MIKIPNYIECLAKVVSFLGLGYSDEKEKTEKFRMKYDEIFVNQGDTYTENYVPKILDLFAGEDKEKRELIKLFLIMSESLVRDLTRKNYYTVASQKRAMWGLLVFYYIPHIASLISIYKKEFGIPDGLIANDFMLPFVDNKGKIVSPTLRLIRYLTPIERGIDGIKYHDASDKLNSYIKNLGKKPVPSYIKHQEIIEQLSAIPTQADKISEISLVFRAAIVSAHIYRELRELFDESYAISLIDYFKHCLKTSDRLFNSSDSIQNNFEYFFEPYVNYYNHEFLYTIKTQKTGLNLKNIDDVLLRDERERLREDIFSPFNSFLYTTINDTKEDLVAVVVKYKFLSEADSLDEIPEDITVLSNENHENILMLLNELDDVLSSPEKTLQQNEVNEFLQEFKNHPFYATYEHEYLYYDGLNDLAKNDFESALKKLEQVSVKCTTITAGETQLKIAEKLIVLTLLANPNFIFSSLNPSIRLMIDAEPEKELLIILPLDAGQEISEEEKYRQIYFSKVLNIITVFNTEGYARYEGIQCVKYNPFEKLEKFVGDSYENDTKTYDSDKIKTSKIIKKLTGYNNLVTFYQWKAVDVFEPINFATIGFSCLDFKIDNKNIFKLWEDKKTLNLIYEAVST